MRKTTLTLSILLMGVSVFSQKIDIKKIELAGDKVIVHYDLDDSNPNNEYQINLYSSTNNFGAPMARVGGDVGDQVSHGINKKVTWNIKDELGPYKGKLAVELRGRVHIPIAKLSNITASTKLKRGKTHEIKWKAGNNNPVHVELFKGGQRVAGDLNQPNNGTFTLFIPQHASVGKDYTIRITDARNAEEVVLSKPFAVKRKVPLILKALPVVAIGAVLATLGGGGGGGGGGSTGSSNIPDPPPIPNN